MGRRLPPWRASARTPSPSSARERAWIFVAALVLLLLCNRCFDACRDGALEQYRASKEQQQKEYERARQKARASDAEEKRKREEQERLRAEAAAIEAARPPAERAKLAMEQLKNPGDDLRAAVCRAHELLDPIDAKARRASEVLAALALLARREAAQLLAERPAFEQSRGLVCGDGSTSGCSCHGSHRGCCSHHHGVVGCEPYPTRVSCPSR